MVAAADCCELAAAAVAVPGVLLPEPVNGVKGFDLGFRPAASFPAERTISVSLTR